ncbi:Beta-galactosidase BoGH2A, partial [termite gut metagenome]
MQQTKAWMKPAYLILYSSFIILYLVSCTNTKSPRERISFNKDWSFQLGNVEATERTFDDSGWRTLNLPHDWAIEGEFSEDNPSGSNGGALPGGIGWYRKTFPVSSADAEKCIFIDFDGVYMNSEVFINGHSLGVRPYGYISFRYDLTPYLKFGEENTLAVCVDNSEQPNSRWYSGCGIYRNVWLTKVNPVHVDLWGTYITTPEVTTEKATITIRTAIKNSNKEDVEADLISVLTDTKGNQVASVSSSVFIPKDSLGIGNEGIELKNPKLWSLETPYLYTLRTEVRIDGQVTDVYETPFGIRTFEFDAKTGFTLNGKQVKIKGVCQHHDLGCLG